MKRERERVNLGFSFCLNSNDRKIMFISFSSFSALSYLELKTVTKKKKTPYFHCFAVLFFTRWCLKQFHTQINTVTISLELEV